MNSRLAAILTLWLPLAATAHSAPRSSANYSITTDTADAGGSRATSASYTNDASIGCVADISTVVSPAQSAKAGYVGQLFEVTGLILTAGASTVNEGGTIQLAAWQELDDSSILAVPGGNVGWSVQAGPLVSIDTGGLATAGVVYQNSAATAEGTYLGSTGTLGLTIVNMNLDNFGTYAGDGIDDGWQVLYFGEPPNALAGPAFDADKDGQTNLFEYAAGLVPTDATSLFRLRIEAVTGQPSQKRVVFNPLVAGRSYTVRFSTDLAADTWATLTGTTQSDLGNERTVTDLNATGVRKFYQVQITMP